MKRIINYFNKKNHFFKNITSKIVIFLTILLIIFSIIIPAIGCSKLNIEIFGLNIGESDEEEEEENLLQDKNNKEIIEEPSSSKDGNSDDTVTNNSRQNQNNFDNACDNGNNDSNNQIYNYYPFINAESNSYKSSNLDISKQRKYFLEGLKHFQDESYLLAEYYFSKIKNDYLVLQDHVLYYLAKSLLLQEKFELAEEYYLKLTQDYPDSIWSEKSNLEYADLFFLKEDYATAEEKYDDFSNNYSDSEYIPYCLFQLAICQEKNEKYDDSYENYKKIWLKYPTNEYSQKALENLNKLIDERSMEAFIPSAEQIYDRGEIFFSFYNYDNAIGEFNKILGENYISDLSQRLYSKTLFKIGMCYYNLRDYSKSKDYLVQSYEKFPSSSVADDSLYFLGRIYTNLDQDNEAISYYQKLLSKFPQSKYSDDALYRMGRIYFFKDDFQNASKSYQRVINEYPDGDRLSESYWELGWIQYRSRDYSSAKNTFTSMASSFKKTSLEEKALFWQAKCCQKIGENEQAINLYKKIINMNSYSYYTFASRNLLSELHIEEKIHEINTSVCPDNPEIADILPDVYNNLESIQETNKSDTGVNKVTHIAKAKELLNLELYTSASLEIEAGSGELEEEPVKILEVSTLFLQSKDYINSQKLISKYYTKLKSNLTGHYMDYFYYLYYPYGYKEYVNYYSSKYNLDSLFTLAVIREESRFQPDAGSFAGALGLMQIVPSTGESISRQIGLANFDKITLLDPETNIKMGTFYLRQMLDNFDQNKFYALGAYNGGPGAMNKWISQWGNMDIDEFIENIPYDETRNYIKKVMGSYYFYQMLYK